MSFLDQLLEKIPKKLRLLPYLTIWVMPLKTMLPLPS